MMNLQELNLYKSICSDFKVVFDVGVREDLDYYDIKPNCQYHLFEPNQTFVSTLKEKISNLSEHDIILNEIGLSDQNIDNCVYYSNTQSFKEHWCVDSIDMGERYSLKRLDDYVSENNIDKIDFIKTDCEELDFKVLQGGINTLKSGKVSFLQVEYTFIRDVVDLLPNFDFYIVMEPVLLGVINILNIGIVPVSFNKSLIRLTDEIITFFDIIVKETGNGGNLFGVNKSVEMDINSIITRII